MDPSFQDSVMCLLREVFPGHSEEVSLLGVPASTTQVFHCWIWWALLLSDFLSQFISSLVERSCSVKIEGPGRGSRSLRIVAYQGLNLGSTCLRPWASPDPLPVWIFPFGAMRIPVPNPPLPALDPCPQDFARPSIGPLPSLSPSLRAARSQCPTLFELWILLRAGRVLLPGHF